MRYLTFSYPRMENQNSVFFKHMKSEYYTQMIMRKNQLTEEVGLLVGCDQDGKIFVLGNACN